MSLLKVRTAQNVQLEYQLASVGQRILGAFIDLVVVILYFIGIIYSMSTFASIDVFQDSIDLIIYILLVIPPALYLPVSEYFWKGQTVGKRILKLKVTKTDGSLPSIGDLILRWLLRTIDVKFGFLFIFFLPKNPQSELESVFYFWIVFFWVVPFPLVGILSMAFGSLNQRLGDLASNTTVILNKRPFSLNDTILQLTQEDYTPLYLNVLDLRDKDIYIIKNALKFAKQNYDYASLDPLATKAKEVLGIKEDNSKSLELLERIVKDYNHLARKRDLVN